MKRAILVITLLISFLLMTYVYFQQEADVEWVMVNENYGLQQADAHFIKVKNGKTILIDVGHEATARHSLLPFLDKKGVTKIDVIFISHPHKDHYGGLTALLEGDISIGTVYFNVPDKDICDKEIPWGCDYKDITHIHKTLIERNIEVLSAHPDDKLDLGNNTSIEVLYAFDGVNTPVGKTGVNDLSLIMMLYHKEYKFLFTGDLNHKIGEYLAETSDKLKATILKVPHHGTEGLAPNEFFEKVSPKYVLVPSPKHLWFSERSQRPRKWFSDKQIPTFVNGISGDVSVKIVGDELIINTSHEK